MSVWSAARLRPDDDDDDNDNDDDDERHVTRRGTDLQHCAVY